MTDTPDPRTQVLDLARAGHGRNEVARRTGIPPTTVTRIAAEAGVTFDRTATAQATEARVIDAKARRVLVGGQLLEDIDQARAQLHAATDAKDVFFAAKAIDALASAHVRIAGVDGPPDESAEAKSLLGALHDALVGKWGAGADDGPQDGQP
ncbi:hypothetical protein [Streptomyces sp. NPDC003730]